MYSIFYTESTSSDFSDRIPNYTLCQRGANLINKYVRENGRGQFPNFPHVLVKTESSELQLINVDKNKLNSIYA